MEALTVETAGPYDPLPFFHPDFFTFGTPLYRASLEASVQAVPGVKAVKAITGASLMDAKKMVESCPANLKEGVSKEDAEKVKADVEAAGGSVELK